MRVLLGLTIVALLLLQGACARKSEVAHGENYAAPPPVSAAEATTPIRYQLEASGNWSTPAQLDDGADEQRAADAKFQAASAKAESLGGVHLLTQADIEGLSYDQIRRLRGY
ncbi:MAG TPA: hypothetical protein VMW68_00145 [Methyloceanibacter sp.]|nr:hypothetical protein [Methyloceanibacter sp.]